jgi:peroxiredoxin
MDAILLLIRLTLFAVFALAAVGKFLDLKGSEKAVRDFGVPEDFSKFFAIALPFAEAVFALCFLFVSTSWVGALGGLILLLSFVGGIVWQMAQGRAPDCHCFGQIYSEPVGGKTLVRNVVFALLALILVASGRNDQGLSVTDGGSETMQLILIFIAVALASAAIFYLRKVLDNQTLILRRLEMIEVISREGVPLERSDAGHPHDGLPIGSPFPEFELLDTANRVVTLSNVLSDGRPSVFFFVSPTCEPCRAMLPEMETWLAELGDRVNFVFLSSGTAEANREKFAGAFVDEIVLQENREVAEAVRARWTPTAVFVRADGTIGSHLAAGDAAMRELIQGLRDENVSDRDLYFVSDSVNGDRQPKIGEYLPEFSLKDIKGNEVTASDLRGKKTVAVFWSPSCPHCASMMKDLKAWDESRRVSDPHLIVFSDGSKEEHEPFDLNSPVVLDSGYKTAAQLGMFGTPSAVLLDETGRIITETGVGASNIWALLGKR